MKSYPLLALLSLVCGLIFSGCTGASSTTASGKVAPPPFGKARLVCYRTALFGAHIPPPVTVNGTEIGRAAFHGYFFADLEPGQCLLAVQTDRSENLTLTLNAGQIHYVRLSVEMRSGLPKFVPEVVDEPTARKDLANCSLKTPKP